MRTMADRLLLPKPGVQTAIVTKGKRAGAIMEERVEEVRFAAKSTTLPLPLPIPHLLSRLYLNASLTAVLAALFNPSSNLDRSENI